MSLLALHNQQLTQLTLQQKESLEELKKENKVLEEKVNKLEREKQAQAAVNAESKHEIEAFKHKVNEDLE